METTERMDTPTVDLKAQEDDQFSISTDLTLGDELCLNDVRVPERKGLERSCNSEGTNNLLAAAVESLNKGVKVLQEGITSNRRAIEKGLEENRKALAEGLERNRRALVNGLEGKQEGLNECAQSYALTRLGIQGD